MPVELLSRFLHHRRAIVSGALAAVIAASWAYLLRGAGIKMEMMDMGGGQIMTIRRYLAAMGPRRSRAVIRDDGVRQWNLGWRCTRRRRHL